MPALVGKEKVNPKMQSALQRHIMREREKKKQEAAEAEKDFKRKAKEEEEKRKKQEEENSTLEDIKEQLTKLRTRHSLLRQEKHQIFSQFRKVLNEEAKQKARLREQSDQTLPLGGQYQQHNIQMNPRHMLPPGYRYQGHSQSSYLTHGQPLVQQGVKRPHSPTPPSASLPMHQRPPTTIHSSTLHSRIQGASMHGSTPDRTNTQHSFSSAVGKPHDSPSHLDDRTRPRISMMQSSQPFSPSLQMRSNSPGRFSAKTDREMSSFSPNSGGFSQHKYQTGPPGTRTKHP